MSIDIIQLMQVFICDADTSLESAGRIEVALDDAYPDDDYIQQTVEMLAMYRPKGGEFLFDDNAIKQRLKETIKHIQAQV